MMGLKPNALVSQVGSIQGATPKVVDGINRNLGTPLGDEFLNLLESATVQSNKSNIQINSQPKLNKFKNPNLFPSFAHSSSGQPAPLLPKLGNNKEVVKGTEELQALNNRKSTFDFPNIGRLTNGQVEEISSPWLSKSDTKGTYSRREEELHALNNRRSIFDLPVLPKSGNGMGEEELQALNNRKSIFDLPATKQTGARLPEELMSHGSAIKNILGMGNSKVKQTAPFATLDGVKNTLNEGEKSSAINRLVSAEDKLNLLDNRSLKNTQSAPNYYAAKVVPQGVELATSDVIPKVNSSYSEEIINSSMEEVDGKIANTNTSSISFAGKSEGRDNVAVLKMDGIPASEPSVLISKLSDYLIQSGMNNMRSLEVLVEHSDLGQFRVEAQKFGTGNQVDLRIETANNSAAEFFNTNEVELIKSLSQSGVRLSSVKIASADNMMSLAFSGDNAGSGDNIDSRENSQGGRQDHGRQTEDERRRQQWHHLMQEGEFGASHT